MKLRNVRQKSDQQSYIRWENGVFMHFKLVCSGKFYVGKKYPLLHK